MNRTKRAIFYSALCILPLLSGGCGGKSSGSGFSPKELVGVYTEKGTLTQISADLKVGVAGMGKSLKGRGYFYEEGGPRFDREELRLLLVGPTGSPLLDFLLSDSSALMLDYSAKGYVDLTKEHCVNHSLIPRNFHKALPLLFFRMPKQEVGRITDMKRNEAGQVTTTKFLLNTGGEHQLFTISYGDYRTEHGKEIPHRYEISGGGGTLSLELLKITGVDQEIPPRIFSASYFLNHRNLCP